MIGNNSDIRRFEGVTRDLITVRLGERNRLHVERDAEVSLQLENGAGEAVTEITVGENARLNLYEIIDQPNARSHAHIDILQSASSQVTVAQAVLQGADTLSDIHVELNEAGATVTLAGLAIVNGERKATMRTCVRHHAPRCVTEETYKFILKDQATGEFDGLIVVDPDAQKTVARQTNKNICLSPTAKMHAQPHLIINADDVVCNHGATVGQLDTDALFYLRQRGIPEDEARQLLLVAFLDDVETHFPDALRETLRTRVEQCLAAL